MSTALKRAHNSVLAAEEAEAMVLKNDYPIGSRVRWLRGSNTGLRRCAGHVVMHSYGDRIKVRNETTETEYWIHSYDIIAGMPK